MIRATVSFIISILLTIILSYQEIGHSSQDPYDLTPHEICLISINKSSADIGMKPLYTQRHCITVPPASSSETELMSLWGTPKHRHCYLGAGHKRVGDAVAAAIGKSSPIEGCRLRSIWERSIINQDNSANKAMFPTMLSTVSSFFSNFFSFDDCLPSGDCKSPDGGHYQSRSKLLRYKSAIFAGDSITVQISNFLSCDLARGGFAIKPCSKKQVISFQSVNNKEWIGTASGFSRGITGERSYLGHHAGGCDVIDLNGRIIPNVDENGRKDEKRKMNWSLDSAVQMTPSIDSSDIMMFTVRSDLPCVFKTCSNVNQSVFDYFQRFSVPQHSLVVFNYGLHIHRTILHEQYDEMVASLAQALLWKAKQLIGSNSTLIFRETSAQHFAYSENGVFNQTRQMNWLKGGYCCDFYNHSRIHRGDYGDDIANIIDPRDFDLIRALDLENSNWRSILGWAPMYSITRQKLKEFHTEANGDCSHFIYIPGISSLLLQGINMALEKLVNTIV